MPKRESKPKKGHTWI